MYNFMTCTGNPEGWKYIEIPKQQQYGNQIEEDKTKGRRNRKHCVLDAMSKYGLQPEGAEDRHISDGTHLRQLNTLVLWKFLHILYVM